MFRLTREVRFGLNPKDGPQWELPPTNSYAGFPSLNGFGTYVTLRVTLRGSLDPQSGYLINIKEVDEAARDFVRNYAPLVERGSPADFLWSLYSAFDELWRERFESVSLSLSPLLVCELNCFDFHLESVMRLSQKFEFSASHRLHNPALSEEDNRKMFGKCSNALGHGHNYEVQVTLKGVADRSGLIIDVPQFEQIVAQTVIDRFDHKNLNVEVPEFADVIPTVENIARVIYTLLKPKFQDQKAKLASVTVWETPKTWCEYSE